MSFSILRNTKYLSRANLFQLLDITLCLGCCGGFVDSFLAFSNLSSSTYVITSNENSLLRKANFREIKVCSQNRA